MRVLRPRSRIARRTSRKPRPDSCRSTRPSSSVPRRAIARRSSPCVLCRRWCRSPATRPARLSTAIRIRSPISPMFGHLPATRRHAIRTGSWLAREALTNAGGVKRYAAASCVIALVWSLVPLVAGAARVARPAHTPRPDLPQPRHVPYPRLASPLEISGSQYSPVAWRDIAGWNDDDHLQAYKAFRVSCKPIAAQHNLPPEPKALGTSLRDPCRAARALEISDGARAKAFFEEHFLPLRISRLGEG